MEYHENDTEVDININENVKKMLWKLVEIDENGWELMKMNGKLWKWMKRYGSG